MTNDEYEEYEQTLEELAEYEGMSEYPSATVIDDNVTEIEIEDTLTGTWETIQTNISPEGIIEYTGKHPCIGVCHKQFFEDFDNNELSKDEIREYLEKYL